jgi:dynein heavy chain
LCTYHPQTIVELQPRDAAGGGAASRDEQVKELILELQDKVPELFDMIDMYSRIEERTPYTTVCLQECDRMNQLISEIRRSLKELFLGLKACCEWRKKLSRLRR